MTTHKIVRISGNYHVVPASYAGPGMEHRPYGTKAECLSRAERLATTKARKGSGGRKGRRYVKREGDAFYILKAD